MHEVTLLFEHRRLETELRTSRFASSFMEVSTPPNNTALAPCGTRRSEMRTEPLQP